MNHDESCTTRIMPVSSNRDFLRTSASNPCDTGRNGGIKLSDADHGCDNVETPTSSPPKFLPSSWLKLDPQLDKQGCNEDSFYSVEMPPLSSSPPDFTSSPCSSRSTESSEEKSLTLASDCPSNLSQNDRTVTNARIPDKFSKKLHQLLLLVQQGREMVDRTDYSFYTDTSLTRTPEFSFVSGKQGQDMDPNNSTSQRNSNVSSPSIHSQWFLEHTSDLERQVAENRKFAHSRGIDTSFGSLSRNAISPINFENRINRVPFYKSTNVERPIEYRIIKRAQSHLLNGIFEQEAEPPSKRLKNGRDSGIHARDRVYARRTASLRRADSLQSRNNDYRRTALGSIAEWVPTVPVTPAPRRTKDEAIQANIFSPVPVIAPPTDHIVKLPMSPETTAKVRLARLLEREASGRQADGLPPGICTRPPPWMLPETGDVNPLDEDGESSIKGDIRFDWEVVMGLGTKRRRSIIDWLLHVLPVRVLRVFGPSVSPSPPSSMLSSGSSTSTSSSDSIHLEPEHNLFDQLQNSPETRFHAVWMFLRFFYLTMPHDMKMQSNDEKTGSPKTPNSHISKTLQQEGLGLIAWDVAVACLSLSVKFHRDFLNPLLPVYAQEYLTLAPHSLTHEDLESAHRDILSCFDYRLGITPQAVMDQLWLALPSLRSLLDFDGGWQKTMRSAWSCLLDFLREPDVQQFPVSVLTAVSLMDGISESLIHQYRREGLSDDMFSKEDFVNSPNEEPLDIRAVWDECKNRAEEDTEGVFCDIQALIGVTDAQLRDCRLWMSRID